MCDGTFVILCKGQTLYKGGNEKIEILSKRGRRTAKTNGEIIYPIFKKAAEYTKNDLCWYKVLDDASKGIFQKMYKYDDNGILTFRKKTTIVSKEICQDNPVLCLKNVKDFMQANGFYSNKDHDLEMEEIERQRNEASQTILEWRTIKVRKTKKILISRYVDYLSNRYSLDKLEISKLSHLMRVANSIGIINTTTVFMENNQIVDIDIICFDPKSRDFFIDPDVNLPKLSRTTVRKYNNDDEEDDTSLLI